MLKKIWALPLVCAIAAFAGESVNYVQQEDLMNCRQSIEGQQKLDAEVKNIQANVLAPMEKKLVAEQKRLQAIMASLPAAKQKDAQEKFAQQAQKYQQLAQTKNAEIQAKLQTLRTAVLSSIKNAISAVAVKYNLSIVHYKEALAYVAPSGRNLTPEVLALMDQEYQKSQQQSQSNSAVPSTAATAR